jgi:hypothetical protein
MAMRRAVSIAALLAAAIGAGCTGSQPPAMLTQPPGASSAGRAGTLSVTEFSISGWRDGSFHYVPTLSVAAPSTGRAVLVQRVDFTADDAGSRRLLRGVRYPVARRVPPGGTADLVSDAAGEALEIDSPLALASVAVLVFYTDDDGQAGIVSAMAKIQEVVVRAPKR